MTRRYQQVVRTLQQLAPDVMLLQEVDSYFMPEGWQSADGALPCGATLDGYTAHQSYTPKSTGGSAGTVVLLRDAAWSTDRNHPPVAVAATEAHGGKTAMVVHARHRDPATESSVTFASVHLRWGSPVHARSLLSSVISAVGERSHVVLGGDFNVKTDALTSDGISAVAEAAGLAKVLTSVDTPTQLDGLNQATTIDHVYATGGAFELADHVQVGRLPAPVAIDGGVGGPWTEATASTADGGGGHGSDHAWIKVAFRFPPPPGVKPVEVHHVDSRTADGGSAKPGKYTPVTGGEGGAPTDQDADTRVKVPAVVLTAAE
jgi:endonuclease/exonuclease/phosphatase family metal-dependent hydrolase